MKRGFTLIELLVVVAIISLLSSVVLASLNSARDKARQSAFRQYLGQVVTAIELNRTNSGEMPSQMFLERLVRGNTSNGWPGLEDYIAWTEPPSFVGKLDGSHSYYANGFNAAFYQTEVMYSGTPPQPYVDLAIDCGRIATNRIGGYVLAFRSDSNDLNFNRVYTKDGVTTGWYCVSDLVR